jgi:predicted HTH transcriptional regulator
MLRDIDIIDINRPPRNKLRKVIFKDSSGLEVKEKLQIVGRLIGRTKKAKSDDIYEAMLQIHDSNKKITILNIANILDVSTRTIYRNITKTIKKEKFLLNEEI